MVSVWLYVPVQCAGALLQSCTARRLLLEDARAPVCFTCAKWFLLPDQAFHGSAIVLCLGPVTKWGLDTCGPAMSCHDILVQCVCCVLCRLSFFFVPSWFTIIRYQQKSRFEACWSCHPMASPLLSKDHCRRLWRVARPKAFGGP